MNTKDNQNKQNTQDVKNRADDRTGIEGQTRPGDYSNQDNRNPVNDRGLNQDLSHGQGLNQGQSQGQGLNQGQSYGQGLNQGQTYGQGLNQGQSQGLNSGKIERPDDKAQRDNKVRLDEQAQKDKQFKAEDKNIKH